MEAVKQRMNELKDEAQKALERAEKADYSLKDATDRANTAESDVQSLRNKITLLELDVKKAEERADLLEKQATDYVKRTAAASKLAHTKTQSGDTQRLQQLQGELKTLDEKVAAAHKRKTAAETKVKKLQSDLEDAEDKLRDARQGSKAVSDKDLQAEALERKKRDLTAQCSRLEKEVEAEQAKYRSVKQELDKTIAELLE